MEDNERTCPDCAETIKSAAKLCRYCGYRFSKPTDEPEPSGPYSPPLFISPPTRRSSPTATAPVSPMPQPQPQPSTDAHIPIPESAGWFERVFDVGDMRRSNYAALGLAGVMIGGFCLLPGMCSAPSKPAAEASSPTMEAPKQIATAASLYTAKQLSMICRAGIAAEFARDPKIMTATEIEAGLTRVEYKRPDDPKIWKSDCKINGNRIVWRTVDAYNASGPGRWRTTENDDVLTFKLDGNAVTTDSSDGSSASETYKF